MFRMIRSLVFVIAVIGLFATGAQASPGQVNNPITRHTHPEYGFFQTANHQQPRQATPSVRRVVAARR